MSFHLTSPWLNTPRSVWIEQPDQPAEDCLIVLDAELYRDRVGAPQIISDLQASGRIRPVTCVYVSNSSAADRHVDYTCNSAYSSVLATDLRQWIERTCGPYRRYMLCGLSLSGLCAASTALEYPTVFDGAICQSPSAWWNDEWLTTSLTQRPRGRGRFWVSVGDQELQEGVVHPPTGMLQKVNQRDSCRRLAQALTDHGKDVHFQEYSGGHDPHCWAEELPEALCWMLNGQV